MGVNGIYGLSGSGMDIESMVKVGMMSKQNEYDKMAQKFTKNEWMKADYIALSSQITTFNNSTLSQYKYSSTMNAKSAESTSPLLKASASSTAANVNHSVDVTALSYNANLVSTGTIERVNSSASDNKSILLKDILFKSLNTTGSGEDTRISGQTLMRQARNLSDGTFVTARDYDFSNNKLTDKAISFYISDGVTKDATTGDIKQVEISFTFDDIINKNVTLNDLASKINNSGLNIRAFYNLDNDKFSMYNTKSGSDNTIDIEIGSNDYSGGYTSYGGTVAANFLNELQLYQSKEEKLYSIDNGNNSAVEYDANTASTQNKGMYFKSASHTSADPSRVVSGGISGADGTIKVDGADYKLVDGKATVDGVTYTALATGKATVSVTQDTDAVIDKVKSFVADYNKLLASLYEKYDEKPNSDYKPLTQSQKDAMKEEQITKWEEKAKAGLLYHDQTIGKIIQNMRSAITNGVEQEDGSTLSVFSIGISTTGLKGQLTLDEDKLKKALEKDSDIVYKVISKPDLEDTAKNGVAQRLGDVFTEATKSIKSRAGSSADITEDSDLNNLLRQLQTRMSNFKKMMATFENALYKKYDAMEATLARLGTQLNFVMGGNS